MLANYHLEHSALPHSFVCSSRNNVTKKTVKRKHLTGDDKLRCVIHNSKLTTKDEHAIELSDKSYQTLLDAKNMGGQLSPNDNSKGHQKNVYQILYMKVK